MENNDQQIKYESVSDEFLSGSLSYLDDVENVKVTKRRRSLKPIMIVVLVIVGLFGGVAAMLSISKRPVEETVMEDSGNEASDVQAQLNSCLRAAQADVEAGDPEFYPKLIASYKAQITCYDRYDNESSAKQGLEDKLNSAEVAARDAGTSQAAIDAEYDRRAAQIDEEYRQYVAALDVEAARHDDEMRRRLEKNAEVAAKHQAELEAERARREAELVANQAAIAKAKAEQEKVARCNEYKAQYGDKSAEELARTDASVVQAYNTWQDYAQKAEEYRNSGVVLSQAQCQNYILKGRVCPRQYEAKAQEAETYYNQLFSQKVQAYNSSRKLACGY